MRIKRIKPIPVASSARVTLACLGACTGPNIEKSINRSILVDNFHYLVVILNGAP